jgi:[ribosomal protein S5]-alanine N-acetyltransferase
VHRWILDTERLRLREFAAGDAAFILQLLNEPGWIANIGDRGVRSLEDARAYLLDGPLASYAQNGFGPWCVCLRDGEAPIGICGLIRRPQLEAPDVGYAFLEAYWGRGYAAEAAAATLAYGREVLKLPQIVALTAPHNAASGRVLQKIGFRPAGSINPPGLGGESRYYVLA